MIGQILNRNFARSARTTKQLAASAFGRLFLHRPLARRQNQVWELARGEAEGWFRSIADNTDALFDGTVLLDGMFDNANYWYRLSLLRGALGLQHGREVGVTGPFNADPASRTFCNIGVAEVVAFDRLATTADRAQAKQTARTLVSGTSNADGVLHWQLPYDVPATVVYDGLLKDQRLPSLDPDEPIFGDRVAAALTQIAAAARLIEAYQPTLVVLSHGCNIRYGALAYLAARAGVPAIIAFGNYGVPRFYRIDRCEDLFDPVDCPRGVELDALTPDVATLLAATGREYLAARTTGSTDDIGGQYAFSGSGKLVDKAGITARFGWSPDAPIVAVYAANWFDFPHYTGMTNFRDFADFVRATFDGARTASHVNWLFRRHPADDFYGGPTLTDVLPQSLPGHVAVCPADLNSNDVVRNADGIVTYHGTVGIEAAAADTPVLVADRGWYHDCGFVTWPNSREDYLATLAREWWRNVDLPVRRLRAEIFAGWYFGVPDWQQSLICADDSRQQENYQHLNQGLAPAGQALARERAAITSWWHSGARFYHTQKMANADSYSLSNVVATAP